MSDILPRFDFRVTAAVAENQGTHRERHQDAHRISLDLAVFAVADGMGGHAAGEVASRLAVEEVLEALAGDSAQRVLESWVSSPDLETRRRVFRRMRAAIEQANDRVRREAAQHDDWTGMGTTLDVVWLARDHAFIAHVGDGRVYLARPSAVLQLTQDHAQLEALKAKGVVHAHKKERSHNRLLNAVGLADTITVDTLFVDVDRGDRLLLCTDGVHGQIGSEAQLSDLLRTGDPEGAANALVQRAGRLGRDNATALVVQIDDRFVMRGRDDRGASADDLERARAAPLLEGLPMPSVLAALVAAVEVEIEPEEIVPRAVANDLVSYVILDGIVRLPDDRHVGAGALLFPESLVGVAVQGQLPVVEQRARLLRLRADDFQEVCTADPELAASLYQRLARHLARVGVRTGTAE